MDRSLRHYVYKTTNIINGRFYIGKHSDFDFNPSYLGSGRAIKHAIKKYGKDSFIVEILKWFDTEEDAYSYERSLLEEFLSDRNCYNLVDGGKGFTSRSAKLASQKAIKLGWHGWRSLPTSKQKEIASIGGKLGSETNRKNKTGMFNMTSEQRSNWSKSYNSNRTWITNGIDNKRIKVGQPIPDKWYIGRSNVDLSSRSNIPCWTNGTINIFSIESPGEGFNKGMTKNTTTGKLPWWNNGIKNKRSVTNPGIGWIKGRLKMKAKIVKCPHCGKSGGLPAMKQHHFDNCKGRNNDG